MKQIGQMKRIRQIKQTISEKQIKQSRRLTVFAVLLVIVLCMCGCGKDAADRMDQSADSTADRAANATDGDTTGSTDDIEETDVEDNAVLETATLTSTLTTEKAELLAKSIVSKGSNYRIQQAIAKLQAGEQVTVAYIGGSITEGYNAGTTEIYAKLVSEYLANTYGNGENVTCVNAGLSGTPSQLGLIRADRDIISSNPDLVFIEFAVNDGQDIIDKIAYENLIRKVLIQDNAPAVMLLFSMTEGGYTCQDQMSQIGFFYSLPMVSVRSLLSEELENGGMKWFDWSDDDVHPNGQGQALYAEMIEYQIDQLAAQETSELYIVPEDTRYGKDWTDMMLYDSSNIGDLTDVSYGSFAPKDVYTAFPNGFRKTEEATENESLTFTFTGSTVFLVYKTVATGNYGTAEVYVDGELTMHLNALVDGERNNPTTQMIYSQDESAEHTVEIRMQPGDEDKVFDVMAIGISRSGNED